MAEVLTAFINGPKATSTDKPMPTKQIVSRLLWSLSLRNDMTVPQRVHNHTKTLEDFSETLKKVADIGYTSVQVSGTCDYEPEWLKEQLKATGLTCDLTHYSFDKVLENPKKVTEDHKIFGCKYSLYLLYYLYICTIF